MRDNFLRDLYQLYELCCFHRVAICISTALETPKSATDGLRILDNASGVVGIDCPWCNAGRGHPGIKLIKVAAEAFEFGLG